MTSAAVANGRVYFNSIYTTAVSCDTSGGSRSYAVNVLTGMPTSGVSGYQSTTGLLSAPVIIVTDVAVGERGSVGGIPQTKSTQVISYGTSGAVTASPKELTGSRPGRLSWREVRNFKVSSN